MAQKVIVTILFVLIIGCAKTPFEASTYSPLVESIPTFITHDFTELDKMKQISRFRSMAGHDYSDNFESNRSMKHYYLPKDEYGNSNDQIKVFSPVKGTITMSWPEGTRSNQMRIIPKDHTYLAIVIFHVKPVVNVGEQVAAGQLIGYADTITDSHDQASSDFDIAVWTNAGQLISYFTLMSDALFANYINRGVMTREDMIISKEYRDTHPEQFHYGTRDWFDLAP